MIFLKNLLNKLYCSMASSSIIRFSSNIRLQFWCDDSKQLQFLSINTCFELTKNIGLRFVIGKNELLYYIFFITKVQLFKTDERKKKLCFNEKKLGEIGAKKLSLLTQQSKGKTLWKNFFDFWSIWCHRYIFAKKAETLYIDERK